MGLLPHCNSRMFASTYQAELAGPTHRLGIPEMGFVDMVPDSGFPTSCVDPRLPHPGGGQHAGSEWSHAAECGLRCLALAPAHNDLRAMILMIEYDHSPQLCPVEHGRDASPLRDTDEPENEWPVIHVSTACSSVRAVAACSRRPRPA